MNEALETILISLATGLIVWVARGFYNKRFEIRPKIHFRLQESGGSSGLDSNHSFFKMQWNNRFIISNNSSFTAYKIKFYIPDREKVIHNFQSFKQEFHSNLFLEPNTEKEFRLVTTNTEKSSDVFIMKNNEIVRKKHPDDLKYFKPKELEDFKMLIEYENEKGKKFYTEFIDKLNHYSNIKKEEI